MEPVRRPVHAIIGWHRNDRIQVAIEFVDRVGNATDVRFRQVTLERRWLDAVHGQRSHELPVPAERLTIGREHGTTVTLDLFREFRDCGWWFDGAGYATLTFEQMVANFQLGTMAV